MSQTRTAKPSRHIPEHVKRAVRARDGGRCRNCKVETEFLHFDHLIPYYLGGPTTADNIQLLCPTCNTSKGNQVTCPKCRHWMSPDKANCSQCGTRLRYTKHADTLAGRLENLFQRVGKVVVLGGASAALLLVLVGGFYAYTRIRGTSSDSEQAASITIIVNNAFTASAAQPATYKVAVPPGASNARVVGGYKVTAGRPVNFYILDETQYSRWSSGDRGVAAITQRLGSSSVRLRQVLRPGTYYLLFSGTEGVNDASGVAAEFYLKHD